MHRSILLIVVLGLFSFAIACGGTGEVGDAGADGGSEAGPDGRDFLVRGPHAVGATTINATDGSRKRALTVEVWYPAVAEGAVADVVDFESGEKRDTLAGLLDDAPASCVASTTTSYRDAAPEATAFPLVFYSHCHNCTRWSAHAVLESLASHGFIVVSADHTDNTMFDLLDETDVPLDVALVDERVADVRFLIDEVLAEELLPAGISFVGDRIGMLGHSIGSITAGAVTQEDARIDAVMGLAAPMENPLLPGVAVANIDVPLGYLVATEDNSILEVGNLFIRMNYDNANTPAYKLEVVDAGHWSVTNIAGLIDAFDPGCGEGERQTNGEPFSYVSVSTANQITASYVTAFFAKHLQDDADAAIFLASNPWPQAAPLESRLTAE